ncbi:SDR family NAD(P)-dependent oxidoreductase [Ruegeria jejuensis]|uniref:SDR family NAD(P)-dependent oxidoreductase n=1 Tax=Ruegeria jejuensis TaxID=3233338 RepID=UPI00355BFF78
MNVELAQRGKSVPALALEGKVALVTGGGRDIGRACALALAEKGASVAVSYNSSAHGANETIAQIEDAGGRAMAISVDLSKPDSAEVFVEAVVAEYGYIDTLVNNAGGLVARKTMEEMTLAHWKAVMDLNLTSVFSMTKACLPHMREKGSIVNLASLAGRDGGGPGAVAYATSKGAVMTMTRGLAKELGPKIRVNALCPGMIDTDFHNVFTKDDVRTKVAASTPLKREGTPQEIGELVAFLATDGAGFVNGACIDVNGGVAFS